MSSKIVVIGAGPGGYIAAIQAAQQGAEVTVIEQETIGGICLNWGCIPSKIMKETAEMLKKFDRFSEFGLVVNGEIHLDPQRLIARQKEVIQNQVHGIQKLFNNYNVRCIKGFGFIKDHKVIGVKHKNSENMEVLWDQLILSVGSQPQSLSSIPFDGEKIISSNDALMLTSIPKTMLIVGGGAIGCEFAFIFSSFGTEVTIVETMPRLLPLPSIDEDCSRVIQREMKRRKIAFLINRMVEKVEDDGEKVRVTVGPSNFGGAAEIKNVKPLTLLVDKVLVCIGRKPNTKGIGLEKLGVKKDEQGWIIADGQMRTNIPEVYAIGDVLGPSRVMLAHVASTEGRIAAKNASGECRNMNYSVVPTVVFTMPEVASVGLTELRAREVGYNIRVNRVHFRTLGMAHVKGEIEGEVKIVFEDNSGKILGIHIVGPHASDIIAEGALAIQLGATVKELANTIHAHPTLSEVMLEVSTKASEKAE